MDNILKIIKSLKESGLLVKSVTCQSKQNNKKAEFFSMLLGTLGVSILGNLSTGKGVIRAGEGAITANKGTIRAAWNC